MDEIKALREEVAKLRERVAVLEALKLLEPVSPRVPQIDWTQPIRVGTPHLVPLEPLPPGTIICAAGAPQ